MKAWNWKTFQYRQMVSTLVLYQNLFLWSYVVYYLKGSITNWKIEVWKIFKTLRRSNSIGFPIHGTNLVFIQENKYTKLTWSNSILKKKLIFNFVTIFEKIPSCYRHFNFQLKKTVLVISVIFFTDLNIKNGPKFQNLENH